MRILAALGLSAVLGMATSVAYSDDLFDFLDLNTSSPSNVVCKNKVCHIYLIGEVGAPSTYVEQYKIFSQAQPGDTIYLHLAGPGGDGDGLIYLVNAIKSSRAKVVSVVDGPVASADALLAVINKDYIINGDTQVLFHSISISNMTDEICREQTGSDRGLSQYSKCMENMPKYTAFYNKTLNKYVYPLLTAEERKTYDEGHDIIIDGDELKKRLDRRGKL